MLSVPFTTNGDTFSATTYASVACGFARDHPSPGVWYKVTGTGTTIEASLCNTPSGDTQLSVWRGSCSNLLCVDGNDDSDSDSDSCGPLSLRSSVTFPTVFGETFYIYICEL